MSILIPPLRPFCIALRYIPRSARVGSDRILFGSDYPLLAQARLLQEINSADLSEEEKGLILAGNARRLLGIKDKI